jgi:hypothetical protein
MNLIWKCFALGVAMVVLGLWTVSAFSKSPSDVTTMTVYKTPTCGCCTKWVNHLREQGFQVTAYDISDLTPIKKKHGVPDALATCHTAIVDGYVVEGHVPADVIQRLLSERPKVVGITVPGMPMGSPGMEGAYSEPYDVLTFDQDGKTQVYTSR